MHACMHVLAQLGAQLYVDVSAHIHKHGARRHTCEIQVFKFWKRGRRQIKELKPQTYIYNPIP